MVHLVDLVAIVGLKLEGLLKLKLQFLDADGFLVEAGVGRVRRDVAGDDGG